MHTNIITVKKEYDYAFGLLFLLFYVAKNKMHHETYERRPASFLMVKKVFYRKSRADFFIN